MREILKEYNWDWKIWAMMKGTTGMAPSPRATTTLASSVSRGGFGSFFRGGS